MARKTLCSAAAALLLAAAVRPAAAANTSWQQRPIQLGTSGGNINDGTLFYCCGGTLGALVEDGTTKYILSNNHVLARLGAASAGEAIIQPGLIDQAPVCYEDAADTVAHLSDFVQLRFLGQQGSPMNAADAAIAEVVAGAVDPDGLILDIGRIGSQTAAPQVGQAVKKSGRTTGLTRGTVGSIKVTVDVGYSDECGGAVTRVARFKNQILINAQGFSAGGDSGSLIVEDADESPRAVGLLFAGASDGSFTVANRINDVLSALNVTLIGGQSQNGSGTGTVEGAVTDAAGGGPVAGARVKTDTGQSAKTDANGFYALGDVPAGSRTVQAAAKGYASQTKAAEVTAGEAAVVDFALEGRTTGKPPKSTGLSRAIEAKSRHEERVLRIPGVVGAGVGLADTGEAVVEVYLEADLPRARSLVPGVVDGVPVRVIVTGPFVAY
jgi:hypothetical protein